jgi:hypothetical protein
VGTTSFVAEGLELSEDFLDGHAGLYEARASLVASLLNGRPATSS